MKALSLIVALLSVLTCACQKPLAPSARADELAFRKPTATEIFNLRSKCADLGQKILDANVIGIALTQDQVSHYDPKTNRCCVELTVRDADLSKQDHFSQYLYDGQTQEMLAAIRNDKSGKWGMVFDRQHSSPIPVPYDAKITYEDALAYIDKKMADERKD